MTMTKKETYGMSRSQADRIEGLLNRATIQARREGASLKLQNILRLMCVEIRKMRRRGETKNNVKI